MEFKDTIGIIDNAFTKEECERIMDRHEYVIKHGMAHEGGYGNLVGHKKSTDYDIIKGNNKEDQALTQLVANKFNELNLKYLKDFSPYGEFDNTQILLGQTYYPVFQIQKYDKGEGHFNSFHLEEFSPETKDRLFVFILYLNDVDKGGETAFYFKEKGNDDYFKVKPKQGRLVIHPASWPYVHKGCLPESSDKYILTAWSCFNR